MRVEPAAVPATRRPGLLDRGRRAVSRWVRPTLAPRAPTGLLTATQLATLRAFAEVVATGEPIDDDAWDSVRASLIGLARERPGFHGLCVRGCRLLDALGTGPFAAAALDARIVAVGVARLAIRPVSAAELLVPGRRVHHEVRELLVPEVLRAFFDSPAGWRLVGYGEVLGECRDPWAYTRRPE